MDVPQREDAAGLTDRVEKNGSGAITKIYADVQANGPVLILR